MLPEKLLIQTPDLITHDYNAISMGNEMFQARVPDEFAERIHQYREDKHMSKSEAVRDLLRRGLEAETNEESDEITGFLEEIAQEVVFLPAVLLSLVGVLLPYPAVLALQTGDQLIAAVTITASMVLMVGGIVVAVLSLLAQLALARPIRGLVGVGNREAGA